MLSKHANILCLTLLLTLFFTIELEAQSLDPGKPTPIRSQSITGSIAARDLGDSRRTDHYYAIIGTPGDLLITLNSRNLNGDLDVFTANGLRPLLKLTLYAESTSPVTKGIYLRKREELILRIEARSPNDDEGHYDLSFGGSFEPIVGGPEIAEDEAAKPELPVATGDRKTKRVSSVGARLPEPEPPVTEVATAQPTPEPSPEATRGESTSTAPKVEPTPRPSSARRTTTRRTTGRRTVTTTTPPAPKETETPVVTTPKEATTADVTAPKSTPPARNTSRRGTSAARAKKPEPPPVTEPEPESGPRLIIETNDGTLINRSMSSVRRVMVENGQVVVTGKDGKIERIALVNVVRMSIAQ
jgi:hypothetical protein